MREILINVVEVSLIGLSIGSWFLVVGGLYELIKGMAENKTKKVCDLCFRDIKKFNQYYKEHPEFLTRPPTEE